MTERREFLENIARRLGRTPLAPPAPRREVGVPDFWKAYKLNDASRVSSYCEELESLGGQAHVYRTLDLLIQGVDELLKELAPARLVSWSRSAFREWGMDDLFDAWSVAEPDEGHDHAKSADVGLTTVDALIADTGTMMLVVREGRPRVTSLLPTVHIALARSSQIVTRMGEAMDVALRQGIADSSAVYFISGPSRSADIENDLSIGVHGPAAVHVFIWDDRA